MTGNGSGRLDGQVMLVTGGARGIGRAIVGIALREGARVIAVDADAEAGAHLVAEQATLSGDGRSLPLLFRAVDVTREADLRNVVDEATEEFGGITALVNNAGRNVYADPTTMTEEQWDDVFAVDLKAAWLCAKQVLPHMKAHRYGTIVNIASLHATLTVPGMFPYAAAKSGLVGMTRSLALEVGSDNIRVNAVSPGYIRTALVEEYFAQHPDEGAESKVLEVQPLGRLGEPKDVAEVVCFLCSPAAAYVTGANWAIDGGLGARFA